MSLREQAAADLLMIHEDTVDGFGWPITITDPDGQSVTVNALTTDVSQMIDPETGQAVTGRVASVSIPLKTLADLGFDIPRGEASRSARPWLVEFHDIGGTEHFFKVLEANPDRTLGCVVCMLEAYKPLNT